MNSRTDWMPEARWGIFAHYLADAASSREATALSSLQWNQRIDRFEIEALADELASLGVPLFGITLGQNSGFFCSPNETYDRLTGAAPSRLSRRDLVGELAEALTQRGIRMLVYLPSHAPAHHKEAVQALRCTPPWNASQWSYPSELFGEAIAAQLGVDDRLTLFQRHWESIIREWSLRWGRRVAAWWIDGVYFADRMYRHADEPKFSSFGAALRAGNPDAVITFNEGVRYRPEAMPGSGRDVVAGEVDFALPVAGRWTGRFIGDEQLQVFTFLGRWWGQAPPRFSPDLVKGYTQHVNDEGGFVMWDVPLQQTGRLDPSCLPQLRALS